jgi:hypothetical protein
MLVLKFPDHPLAVTVLNFGREDISEEIDLGDAGKNAAGEWTDILSGKAVAPAGGRRVTVHVPALTGTTLVPSKGR